MFDYQFLKRMLVCQKVENQLDLYNVLKIIMTYIDFQFQLKPLINIIFIRI